MKKESVRDQTLRVLEESGRKLRRHIELRQYRRNQEGVSEHWKHSNVELALQNLSGSARRRYFDYLRADAPKQNKDYAA